jgi:hypothetical protein
VKVAKGLIRVGMHNRYGGWDLIVMLLEGRGDHHGSHHGQKQMEEA